MTVGLPDQFSDLRSTAPARSETLAEQRDGLKLNEVLAKLLRTRRSASLRCENRPFPIFFGGPSRDDGIVAVFYTSFARASNDTFYWDQTRYPSRIGQDTVLRKPLSDYRFGVQ